MKVKQDYILRDIADEHIVVPIGEGALKGVISLSESGAFLWKKMNTDQSEASLVNALLDEYNIDASTAEADVRSFIAQLLAIGCID